MLDFLKRNLQEYEYMDYTFKGYLIRFLIPFVGLGILSFVLAFMFSDILGVVRYLLYGFSVFVALTGIFYPKIWASTRSKELEKNLHLFITHLGVLATTGVARVELFRILGEKEEEYGSLAKVSRKISILVNNWNQSLDSACAHVAETVPSKLVSDFLERMSHSLEAGQSMRDFVMDEQEVLMSDYESNYKDSLDSLMELRDIFTSVLLAIVFLVIFAVLVPIISGMSPLFLLGVAISVFVVSEVGFLLAAEFILPDDPIWADVDFVTPRDTRIAIGEIISIVLFVVLSVFVALELFFQFPFHPVPLPISLLIGIPFAPLIFPGLVAWREEGKMLDRDEQFPSFIRSLGSIASTRQTTSADVLVELKEKDFSELTDNVKNLYRRLETRIDNKTAWSIFSAETGSFLIWKFSDMYYEGISNGGDPREIGRIISNNFEKTLRVRKKRFSNAGNIMGLLYGMTVGVMIAIFLGFYLTTGMIDVVGSVSMGRMSEIFSVGVYDIPAIHFMLMLMVLVNAAVCSLFIRTVRGGHELTAFAHNGILIWLGVIMSMIAEMGLEMFVAF